MVKVKESSNTSGCSEQGLLFVKSGTPAKFIDNSHNCLAHVPPRPGISPRNVLIHRQYQYTHPNVGVVRAISVAFGSVRGNTQIKACYNSVSST